MSLDGAAAAAQVCGDVVDRPACRAEPGGFDGRAWWRRLGGFEVKHRSGIVTVGRSESAVPSLTCLGIFGAQGQGKAGKAGRAADAASESQPAGLPLLGVVDIRVYSRACRQVEVIVRSVVDQAAKLSLAPSKEVRVVHVRLPAPSGAPAVAGSGFRVSWGGSRRTRLLPSGHWPGVAQAAAGLNASSEACRSLSVAGHRRCHPPPWVEVSVASVPCRDVPTMRGPGFPRGTMPR